MKEQHAEITDNTDDQGINDLANDEAIEDFIRFTYDPEDPVSIILIKGSVNHSLDVTLILLFINNQIDSDKKTDDHIQHRVTRADTISGDQGNQLILLLNIKICAQPCCYTCNKGRNPFI